MSDAEHDDDPLLDGLKIGHSTFYRQDTVKLSYHEVERLIASLDEITESLTQHLANLENEENRNSGWTRRPKRCQRLRACFRRSVYKLTGAKGISFTIILQLVCLVLLTLVDNLPRTDSGKKLAAQMGSVGMMILQISNLVIVILISAQLAKQLKRRKVSGILLMQSYVATLLLFAGLYTATFRFNPKSWKFIEEDMSANPALIVEIYCRFLFFSVSTATLCGAADALPKSWYTSLFASIQMLLSFMYFTSVLSTVLVPFTEVTSESRRHMTRELRSVPQKSITEIITDRRRLR